MSYGFSLLSNQRREIRRMIVQTRAEQSLLCYAECSQSSFRKKVEKGARWMPWLTEAMKDVISCDKPRVGANNL